MSRRKVINVVAVLLTAWLAVVVVSAPASVARPVSLAVLGVTLTGIVVVILRSMWLARRRASRPQPPA